ncbi:MAG: riboflavin kinase/FMN adenylyltransferase [Pirellulaceae bacterium]
MKILRDLENLPDEFRRGAIAIGNFDGVHRGHARIIQTLRRFAERANGPAIVFTFDPHPVRLLRPEAAPPPLTWTERKAELLGELGIDAMVAYPTDLALLGLTPEEFFDQIIIRQLAAKAMVEGPNFFFGRDRGGDIETLQELCNRNSVALEIVQPLIDSDAFVSSSRVRELVAAGNVGKACELLTRPYRIRGMVVHGARRGNQLGFPTANLDAIDTLLPGVGVYAGRAHKGSQSWRAAINIGPNPTFGEDAIKVEVHLIGFSETLYGEPLEVDFFARLRDIQSFDSLDDLKTQLAIDVEQARKLADPN